MAKKSIISTEVEGTAISFNVEGAGSFFIDYTNLTEELRTRALVHGIVQKISDAAAMPKADLPSDPIEAAKTKLEAMQSVADRLIAGDWSKRNGEGGGPVAGVIFRAFAEWVEARAKAAKKPAPTAEAIRAVYDAKTKSEQLALRSVPEIAAIIERIKSERGGAAVKVDADSLLDELGL